VRLVALAECGTMALLGAAFDSIEVGERDLVVRLLGRFAPGVLVLADRGFPSFELWHDAVATGADLAWRVSASFALPVIERLSDGTYLSQIRGRKRHERITVRVVEYSVKDADTGISEVFALITTLLDPDAHPALDLAGLYAARWQVELLFKILKGGGPRIGGGTALEDPADGPSGTVGPAVLLPGGEDGYRAGRIPRGRRGPPGALPRVVRRRARFGRHGDFPPARLSAPSATWSPTFPEC